MIVVKLAGGLGNQMFQYAAGRALSCKFGCDLVLDTSFLLDRTPRKDFVYRSFNLDIFELEFNFATPELIISFGRMERFARYYFPIMKLFSQQFLDYRRENPYSYDARFSRIQDDTYIEGFWQSEMYFKDFENIIRKDFKFKNEFFTETSTLLRKIESSNSVCLNVRRGDFVTNPKNSIHHGHCTLEYFSQAINYFKERMNRLHFFVFSDDIEWCKQHFNENIFTIISHDFAGYGFGQYLYLMSQCKNFIIPNSSFAWWAAWLNRNDDKVVIAPQKWYNNPKMDTSCLLPKSWIVL